MAVFGFRGRLFLRGVFTVGSLVLVLGAAFHWWLSVRWQSGPAEKSKSRETAVG